MSPRRNSTLSRKCAMCCGLPVERLSRTRTRLPWRTSSSAMWEPMKPDPPVTSQTRSLSAMWGPSLGDLDAAGVSGHDPVRLRHHGGLDDLDPLAYQRVLDAADVAHLGVLEDDR